MKNLKSIFDNCGFSYIFYEGVSLRNRLYICDLIKQNLNDQFEQEWRDHCQNSSKGKSYRLFTNDIFEIQNYITSEICNNEIRTLARFRCTNHKLPIEIGRWINLDREERMCNLCESDIGDEFHYVMQCPFLNFERSLYLPEYLVSYPNIFKFHLLFSTKDTDVLKKLCLFIKKVNQRVTPPG